MSMKTPDQVLIELGTIIEDDWGLTPLQDPIANRSDNLVRLVSGWALSISDLHHAFEAYIQRDNISALDGELLTVAAALRGIYRKTGTFSKTTIMVTGAYCAKLPKGSELKDRFGSIWITQDDIELITKGVGCAFAQGIACAKESGTYTLLPNELSYDNTLTPLIYTATNGLMLDVGGQDESDQSLRDRVINRGPLARVCGTSDAAIDTIYSLDGVNFARYAQVESCIGNGWMFIVSGGDDGQICDAIKLHAGLGPCSLVGSTDCIASCADVRFQRPCPILINLKVKISCDCPVQDTEAIKTLILSAAPQIARQTRIASVEIAKLSSSIISVEMSPSKKPLYLCPDFDSLPVITDPIDNTEIIWGTNDPNGICGGTFSCEKEYSQVIKLQPWHYPIIDVNYIEVERDCTPPDNDGCVICD